MSKSIAFYVSADGNDDWSGRLDAPNADRNDGPFATLTRSRDAIRDLWGEGDLKQPVTVMVREGKYYLGDTFRLGPKDTGDKQCPVTYRAYPGEKPILSGGRRITGWEPYRDGILRCDVPGTKGGKWRFRQLFLNGERQIRARYPNFDPDDPLYGGYAQIEDAAEEHDATAFRFKSDTFPRRWAKPTEGEVFIWPCHEWGDTCIIPIQSVDWDKRVIAMAHRTKNFDISPWFFPTWLVPGNRFYVENLLEELDQPGEWCLDSEEGVLYFRPPCDGIDEAEVVAPALDRLIELNGVAYVTISGFTLTETMYQGDNIHPACVQGTGGMFADGDWKYCGEAIHLERTEHCVIEDNRIYAVGGNGIYLRHYSGRDVVRRNEISYAGANGVALAGGKVFKVQDRPEHPMNTEVTDNRIHHCGFFHKYSAGIFLGRSEGVLVAHNDIHHLPHHGVNLGDDGYGRNIVEYNRICHTALETFDSGAINVWMAGPVEAERAGHVIRCNFIADSGRPGGACRGIYLDDQATNCFVCNNIVVRATSAPILIKGKNNVVENNILIGGWVQLHVVHSWWFDHYLLSNRFCRNILVGTSRREDGAFYATYLTRGTLRTFSQCDHNLFFDATGGEPRVRVVWGYGIRQNVDPIPTVEGPRPEQTGFGTQPTEVTEMISLTEWQDRTGFDTHSVVADPLFVDSDRDDYRLKADSPAWNLAFKPMDVSRIGPRRRDT